MVCSTKHHRPSPVSISRNMILLRSSATNAIPIRPPSSSRTIDEYSLDPSCTSASVFHDFPLFVLLSVGNAWLSLAGTHKLPNRWSDRWPNMQLTDGQIPSRLGRPGANARRGQEDLVAWPREQRILNSRRGDALRDIPRLPVLALRVRVREVVASLCSATNLQRRRSQRAKALGRHVLPAHLRHARRR